MEESTAAATRAAETVPLPPVPFATLYVGDLDPDVGDSDLMNAFGLFGSVSSVHVCRNKLSGESLRYGYVNFLSFQNAEEARRTLNHTEIKGKPIRIMWSDHNQLQRRSNIGNLFVKNLDASMDGTNLEELFSVHGSVVSCKVAIDRSGNSKRFGFVQMDSKEAAEKAIEALNGLILTSGSPPLYVGRFVGKSKRQTPTLNSSNLTDHWMSKGVVGFVSFHSVENVKKALVALNGVQIGKTIYARMAHPKQGSVVFRGSIVYVQNLDDSSDDKELLKYFGHFGQVLSSRVIYDEYRRSKGYGFVCFSSPEEAQVAVEELHGSLFHGKRLYVAIVN